MIAIRQNLTLKELEIESQIAWREEGVVQEWAYQYNIFTNESELKAMYYIGSGLTQEDKRDIIRDRFPLPSIDWQWEFSNKHLFHESKK